MTIKWNSRPGRRATGTPGTDKAVRHTKWIIAGGIAAVSYTHLDVYKRQVLGGIFYE